MFAVFTAILMLFGDIIKKSAASHRSDGKQSCKSSDIPEWVFMLIFFAGAALIFSL